ncbi:MAG: glycerol-3-phosphate 1-O-acyltransferase PlsY [Planctomycetota bacterium]
MIQPVSLIGPAPPTAIPLAALAPTLIVLAYLAGSIPFGWLIAKRQGVNIFEHGSGNIGATNVGRVLGKPWGVLCFVLDVSKGLVPTLVAGWALGVLGQVDPPMAGSLAWLGVMAATIVGHIASPWLGLRGGKGVATGLGAFAGVFPVLSIPAGIALLTWLAALRLTHYVSLASCIAALALPVSLGVLMLSLGSWRLDALWLFVSFATAIAVLVVWKHRGNLARIRLGTEPKVLVKE